MTEHEKRLEDAIINIQCLNQFSLFRIVVYQFKMSVMEPLPMPVTMKDPRFRTACVNWFGKDGKFDIKFSPEFLDTLNLEELIFVMLHEMLHVLHLHSHRFNPDEHNMKIFNIAADHVINSVLKADITNGIMDKVISFPKDAGIIIERFEGHDYTVEEVYELLIEEAKENSDGSVQIRDMNISDSFDGNSMTIDQNGQISKVPLDTNNENLKDVSEGEDEDEESEENKKELEDIIKAKVKELLADMSTAREYAPISLDGRGNESSKVLQMLKELMVVFIPLDQLLERAVCQKLRPSIENKSWRRLNPFYRVHGYRLPGRGEELALDSSVFVLDTSASMSDYDVKEISSAVVNIFPLFTSMTVIKHDHNITSEDFYDGILYEADLLKITGRGGTSHQEPFDRIQELFDDNEHGIGLVVIATDYGSDIEELIKNPKYTWLEEIPIQVILPSHQTEMIAHISKEVDDSPLIVQKAS